MVNEGGYRIARHQHRIKAALPEESGPFDAQLVAFLVCGVELAKSLSEKIATQIIISLGTMFLCKTTR
jgi:hypothetical protein